MGYRILIVISLVFCYGNTVLAQAPTLQDQLVAGGIPALATSARLEGDAQRGAIIFHQPSLACVKCHSNGLSSGRSPIGPDLTLLDKATTVESLIESVLEPSKVIRKGFETSVINFVDGRTLTCRVLEDNDEKLVVRDLSRPDETVFITKTEIEDRTLSSTSMMPAGQVNVLANRQQFLDLIKYLSELVDGGPERARQLQPPQSMFAFVLPDYEKQIDHAGMIRESGDESYQRGEAIYTRLCINCHGTKDQPGSLPTSLRFAGGQFKNGQAPHRMYETLTYGFGLMAPQTWMVPQQKYDVIHYIREAYLKPHNPTQYTTLTDGYLASLPIGTSRGPAPSTVEPWSSMNYGPFLMATYEVGTGGTNFAHKGVAIRLESGPGGVSRGSHWQVFDHDTLRVAAAWSSGVGDTSNFIDWHGINFDGRHQIHPRVSGSVGFSNPTGPGWADPETGSFADPRVLGRDSGRYGPLPRNWGRFRGLYHFGDQVILSYTIGKTEVLEMPSVTEEQGPLISQKSRSTNSNEKNEAGRAAQQLQSSMPVYTRTFQIGPRTQSMILKVATHPSPDAKLKTTEFDGASQSGPGLVATISSTVAKESVAPKLIPEFKGKNRITLKKSKDFDLVKNDFTIAARIKTTAGGTVFSQAPTEGNWIPNGKTLFVSGGRLTFDIGFSGAVTGKTDLCDGRWHDIGMVWQASTGTVQLFVDGQIDGQGTLKSGQIKEEHVIRIGYTSRNFPDPTFYTGQIDAVRFYQRGLTVDELRNPSVSNDKQLVGHWEFEKCTEGILKDESGHGHDGEIKGVFAPVRPDPAGAHFSAALSPMPEGAKWMIGDGGSLLLSLPPGENSLKFVLSMVTHYDNNVGPEKWASLTNQQPLDLVSLTKGGPPRWLDELQTEVNVGPDHDPFAVDVLNIPSNNPWFAQMRLTGFDLFDDRDRMAVCTWDGDVWIVRGLETTTTQTRNTTQNRLAWRRIATGLFQPLGLKIVNGQIFVACRDQIAILRDLNGDGETDFVECFNSDHQVTEHFHEFAMGLQTDTEGNFYYAKSARHALPAVVPHHGTLLRVSADGSHTDIVANGFRAANGVCLNPDGSFVVTDQEGHWNPKNRINWVTAAKPGERPHFYGNMFGYHDMIDDSDQAMEPPLCWITNSFDRSPAELVWVTSKKWGPLQGALLNLSYGYGKLYVVPHETIGNTAARSDFGTKLFQGGMCELPLPAFPTGIMRGRFSPHDGHLYVCGMFAWAGSATQPGGFYRVRATGKPVYLPIGLNATKKGVRLLFSGELDSRKPLDPSRFTIRTWSLKRTAEYGSKHYGEKTLKVVAATISADHQSVFIEIPEIEPTWCMSIEYHLTGMNGEAINGLIHNTIHALAEQ